MGIACGALPWRLNMHKLNSYFGMAENDYLYAKGGIYTEMFDRQAQFYRDDPNDAAGPEAALRKTAADTQV